jgi:hypothetical protein
VANIRASTNSVVRTGFHQHHVDSALGQAGGHYRPGGPTADHDHFSFNAGCAVHRSIIVHHHDRRAPRSTRTTVDERHGAVSVWTIRVRGAARFAGRESGAL